jgi:hypothetical protein
VLGALVVLRRAGLGISIIPIAFARVGSWILVGLLLLGALMNLASRSPWERFGWGSVALILALLCLSRPRRMDSRSRLSGGA